MEIKEEFDRCIASLKYMTDDDEKRLDEYLKASQPFIALYSLFKVERRAKKGSDEILKSVLKERVAMERIEVLLRRKGMDKAEAKEFVNKLKTKIEGIV